MAKELLKRSEVPVADTWALEDLYETREAWEKDLAEAERLGDAIAALEGKLSQDPVNLYEAIRLTEEMERRIERAALYASCLYDEDTANHEHMAMDARIGTLVTEIDAKTSYMSPEILHIAPEVLDGFYDAVPELNRYRSFLQEILRMQPFTLSAEMERLLALAGETVGTPSNTFGVLNNADLPGILPKVKDENGDSVQLSHSRLIVQLLSTDREVRKEAYHAYYDTYHKFLNTYAALYNGQVKQLTFKAKARGYAGNLEAAVQRNNVTPVVYETLLKTVDENLDAMHRYVALRKKALGVDSLHMYDIYVPIIDDYKMEIPFEKAKEITVKALEPLGKDYVDAIREGYENRWIDVIDNIGKRSGAYENAAYGVHPYVLLNYADQLDDMFTLIHEMGHALHSYYSNRTQDFFDSHYKIFVAEVASTCNEVLLLEYLLKNCTDVAEKKYLLNHYLEMFKGTLFRQTQFAEFELKTNRMVEAGESLNAENLSKLYREINEKYYGPEMDSDEIIAMEWARIPHFYYNFYVYQYATCFSAAVAIAHDILREGEPAVARYKKFLSSGCSKPPVELLREMGVDLETERPVREAIDVMRSVLDELEALMA